MTQKDVGAKAIVFSQFVNMLDLLDYRIQKSGIQCVKLLGFMNLEQRDKVTLYMYIQTYIHTYIYFYKLS